jgi:hypothetical protein
MYRVRCGPRGAGDLQNDVILASDFTTLALPKVARFELPSTAAIQGSGFLYVQSQSSLWPSIRMKTDIIEDLAVVGELESCTFLRILKDCRTDCGLEWDEHGTCPANAVE